jgi:pimeloyl-ACP methyl ester carboxylesterase
MATNMRHITARPPDLRALAGSITGYRMRAFASDVPLTIVWGELDRFTPYSTNAERARQLFPTATHVTLPGCGHLPFYDDPELVSSVLLEAMSDG